MAMTICLEFFFNMHKHEDIFRFQQTFQFILSLVEVNQEIFSLVVLDKDNMKKFIHFEDGLCT